MKNGKKQPLVYILVLCNNSRKWLDTCLSSLQKTNYSNYKIIVIDNKSADDSIQYIKQNFPNVDIILNKKNYGWCRGNNIGIKKAIQDDADYVVLLNSDINAEDKNWLKELVNFLEKNPTYQIAGCIQYEYNSVGWDRINSWTDYILFNGPRDVFFMWQSLGMKTAPFYTSDVLSKEKYLDCYFVQGAAMMVDIALFKKIGLFDTIYYIFYDEVDFSRRARLINRKTALVTTSRIKHVGAGDTSSPQKKRWKNYLMTRNKYIFLISDVSSNRWLVIWNLFKNDIRDSLTNRENISSILQLLGVFISIFFRIPLIICKRYKEKRLRKQI